MHVFVLVCVYVRACVYARRGRGRGRQLSVLQGSRQARYLVCDTHTHTSGRLGCGGSTVLGLPAKGELEAHDKTCPVCLFQVRHSTHTHTCTQIDAHILEAQVWLVRLVETCHRGFTNIEGMFGGVPED